MKRAVLLVVACLWFFDGGPAWATMVVQDYSPQAHDRFYEGPDKAFIGGTADFSGVGRSGRWATMISPSYFISATHYHPEPPAGMTPGATVYFYYGNDPDDGYETRTVASGQAIAGTDLWLGKLSSPVSGDVEIYPILDLPTMSDYNDQIIYTFGLSNTTPTQRNVRLGRNNIDPGSYDIVTDGTSTGWTYLYDYDNPGGLGADESYLQSGDSGGPSFVMYGGLPALVGIHWFINDPGDPLFSGDSFVPHYIQQIQAAMVGEQLTLIPEPGTLVLLATLAAAWAAWYVRRHGGR